MEGTTRREEILKLLKQNENPISGTEFSKLFDVSRQVIVQDIALMRAANEPVLSTTRGYILREENNKRIKECICVKHTTEQIEDELCAIVDCGGKILDVIVTHDVYGEISTPLVLSNRQEVYAFVQKIRSKNTVPLHKLTDGTHFHTIEADNENVISEIKKELRKKGYLIFV